MVMDQFLGANNGTTITSERFARELARNSHEVRVVCKADPDSAARAPLGVYPQGELRYPLIQHLIDEQGMAFARPDDVSLREALAWCDVVHLLMPSDLTYHAVRIAREMGVPATAAFHVQPQNLSSSIHLGKFAPLNDLIFRLFRRYLYQYVDHVQCPSMMIARQLVDHGYTNVLHVISNGIDDSYAYRRIPKDPSLRGRLVVTMVGRYSVEKRQDVVIRAIARSRHRATIVLVLAGQGPTERRLRRLADSLGVDVRFGFLSQARLHDLLSMTDLYVHASDMETEAMSCMEAFATGLVPVIANSPLSATPQFALCDRSLFRAGDPTSLAEQVDWWLEHPDERDRMGQEYARLAERYRVGTCVSRFERMLRQAIDDARAGRTPTPGIVDEMATSPSPSQQGMEGDDDV